MRRPASDKQRTRARRAAERAIGRRLGATDDVLAPEQHAQQIAELYLSLRKLDQQRARVLASYDAALLAARRDHVSYAVLGDAILVAVGRPRTEQDLARVETSLRVATHTAVRRANHEQLARDADKRETDGVRLLKRVTEIYEYDDHDEREIADALVDHDLDLDEIDEDERRADSPTRED